MIEFEYIKDIVVKNKISIISIILGIASIIGSGVYVYMNRCDNICNESINNLETVNVAEESTENNLKSSIKVDIKGAVKKPGVYELEEGSTIMDALTNAGGITSKGSTSNINLSKKVNDEMVIYVFTKDELKKKETVNELVCEIPKCECETITVTECPQEVNGNNTNSNDSNHPKQEENADQKISLNTATVQELTTLDGIGESKAEAIIEYRNTNGPFKAIEDIMKVSGIGEKAFEKIKDRITL